MPVWLIPSLIGAGVGLFASKAIGGGEGSGPLLNLGYSSTDVKSSGDKGSANWVMLAIAAVIIIMIVKK